MIAMMLMTEEEVAGFGRPGEDSGFGALRTERGVCLPLAAMDVDAAIAGVVASIEVAQTFVNTTGLAIEATYMFPLPDRAAVNRFRMEVAGRVIEGVIDERGAAREQYEQAIATGHRAAITEEERPGVFTLRVGNLMPGESATIRISLVGPLPVDDGELTFRFPLVVAPRYMPGQGLGGEQAGLGVEQDTSLVPDASRISPPVLLPGLRNPVRLGIRVALMDHDVRDVKSSLHAVTASNRDARVVELGAAERLDRDFILRWRVDRQELTSSLVCSDDADGKGGSFMLTLVPPSTLAVSQKPRDVVFVIDRSGSMQGWKMLAARRATARMIDTLTSRDRFHVIAFDTSVEVLPETQAVYATDRNRYRAVEELGKVDARGGTEMALPLQLAVKTLAGGHDDRERVIVLVTDGQVGNEDHILREIAPSLKNIRVFTLGIDQAVNAGFLRRFAGAGGGLCELVESEDRLDEVMAKVHRRIGTPVATEMRLSPSGLDLVWRQVAPSRLPDVYAGSPVTIFGRYKGRAPSDAAIGIEGTSYGDPLNLRVTRESGTSASWVAASWARAHIRDLEDKYATGARELDSEIVRVSKEFSVLSRFTAFLAVDKSQVVNPGGGLVQVVQPVESPAGWEMEKQSAVRGSGHLLRRPAPMMSQPAAGAMPPPMAGPASMAPSRARVPSPGYAGSAGAPKDSAEAHSPPPAAARPAGRMPAPALPMSPPKVARADESKKKEAAPAPTSPSAYLAKLAQLARELESLARTQDKTALRLLRQRLKEWAEDLRSVGSYDTLADAVGDQAEKIGAALSAPGADLTVELQAIANILANLASGGPLPPRKSGRAAFWK